MDQLNENKRHHEARKLSGGRQEMQSSAYLDHAAAALPSPEQMEAIAKDLQQLRLTNPHSHHPSAVGTTNIIENTRNIILKFFNTDRKQYHVIFTSGATQSLHLIADLFDFNCKQTGCSEICKGIPERSRAGNFVYMLDAHTSVTGMRELVRSRCRNIWVIDFDHFYKILSEEEAIELATGGDTDGNDLFVITAMSNFCGRKYPLDVIQKIHHWRPGRSFVCLDATTWVATSYLDLSVYQPDFITLSFYKIFGYPTGVGALIIRTDRQHLLKKQYYGGGTVNLIIPDTLEVYPRDNYTESFEDGTVDFWGIAALKHGFEDVARYGGIQAIQQKTYELATAAYRMLKELKFPNGKPLAEVYCFNSNYGTSEVQGPIIAFSVLHDDGSYVGYVEVEKMCNLYRIEVRTGCFCNQAACQRYLKLTREQLIDNYKHRGKHCGDQNDIIDGRPVGAARISFGRQSSERDLEIFRNMLETAFLISSCTQQSIEATIPASLGSDNPFLSALYVYPIQGCAPIATNEWNIVKTGLAYDRCWMVIREDGVKLRQKQVARMCLVKPEIKSRELWLSSKECSEKEVLRISLLSSAINSGNEEVKIADCGDEAALWLDRVLHEVGCRLHRQYNLEPSGTDGHLQPVSLSSKAPYLLINRSSAAYFANIIGVSVDEIMNRFRPSFIIDGLPPFFEEQIKELTIGNVKFEFLRPCIRCHVICIDQETGEQKPDLLLELRKFRLARKEKIKFGIYLQHKSGYEGHVIRVGDKFQC